MVKRLAVLVVLMMLLSLSDAQAVEVSATVDRTELYVGGEPLTLTISVDDKDFSQQPDWSPLQTDFEILGRPSVMSSSSFMNGVLRSSRAWELTLRPKREGRLTIPALTVGDRQTIPIEVVVKQAPTVPVNAEDLIIRASIDQANPYVQQQVIYTLSIMNARAINREQEPRIQWPDGIVAQALPRAPSGRVQIGNRFFLERKLRFALFPERSGSLTIPPPRYTAWLRDQRSRSPFARGERVDVIGDTLTLEVRPKPAAFTGDFWLPASNVSLEEEWPQNLDFSFRAGEPSSWLISLRAEGQLSTQLPQLIIDPVDGARIYPDRERVGDDFAGNWIGQREERLALIPDRAGPMMLPEIRVQWWDTNTDQQREAVIPARQVNVAPAVAGAGDEQDLAVVEPSANEQQANDSSQVGSTGRLRMVGVALLALLAATLALAWVYRRQRTQSRSSGGVKDRVPATAKLARKSTQQWLADISSAEQRGDSRAIEHLLLTWASTEGRPMFSLRGLSERVADIELSAQLDGLDRAIYSSINSHWSADKLLACLQRGWPWPAKDIVKNDQALPALYPEPLTGGES